MKISGDVLLKPIVSKGGQDISDWFNPKTKDVSATQTPSIRILFSSACDSKGMEYFTVCAFLGQIRTHVDPLTGCTIPHTPLGRFVHIPPPCPDSKWANDFGRPWWKDDSYCIGILSKKTRLIKIINTLTSQEQVLEVGNSAMANLALTVTEYPLLEMQLFTRLRSPVDGFHQSRSLLYFSLPQVCSEETMSEILQRYLAYNAHAASYTWKYDGANLDMDKTLEENNIPDEDEKFYELSMNDDTYLQAVHLYFNDDLTER